MAERRRGMGRGLAAILPESNAGGPELRELEVEEGGFPLEDLEGASEAFLASTVREVQAISAVNETELAEWPGRRTQAAAEALSAILDRELAASASS